MKRPLAGSRSVYRRHGADCSRSAADSYVNENGQSDHYADAWYSSQWGVYSNADPTGGSPSEGVAPIRVHVIESNRGYANTVHTAWDLGFWENTCRTT